MKTKVVLTLLAVFLFSGIPKTQAQSGEGNRQLTQAPQTRSQNSQRRLALVIGNGAYQHTGRLANPPNDATLVAATLRQLGFEVKNGANLVQREMKRLIREFGQTLRTNGGVGLFYFAGHGVQAKGRNYLVPVDADIQTEADLEDVAVDLNYVLNLMDDAQNGLNIVILDACRNNPFARSFRSAQEGLAQVKAPTGTLIAYATAPDSIAADGAGTNSPYTQELIKQMRTSGVLLETMFRRVTEQVSTRTGGKQEPWFSANVKGDFYFVGGSGKTTSSNAGNSESATPDTISKIDPVAIELSYWDSIKNSTDPADFRSYLDKYPNGQFAELARRRAGNAPASSPANSTGRDASSAIADQYVKSGDQFIAQRKWDDANSAYKRAVDIEPNNPEWHMKLGFALHQNGKYAEAETEYRVALRLSPNSAEARYGIGRALREQNKLSEAEIEIKEAIRLEPSNAKYHAGLGNTYGLYQNKWAEAEAELAEAIRLAPKEPDWHSALANLLVRQRKYAEAETAIGNAIRLEPGNGWWRNALAEILSYQQKYSAAETELREALRLDPNEPAFHAGLGRMLAHQKKWAEAESELRQAVKSPDAGARAHTSLSWILRAQQKYSEAESVARQAVRLAPAASASHAELAFDLSLQGKGTEAESEAREAIRLAPANAWAHHVLGHALEKQGRFKEAESAYREALRLSPNDAETQKRLGYVVDQQSRKTYKIAWGIKSSAGWNPSPGTLVLSNKGFDIDTGDGKHLVWDCENFKRALADDVWIREIKGKNTGAMFRLQFQTKTDAAEALARIKQVCSQR